MANPRRLDCHNRNVWVPGEDKQPYRPGRADFAIGPLLIPGLRGWAHARPASYGQDHQFKVGVLVRAGQTATLVIPAAFHRVAGLQYAEQVYPVQTPAEARHGSGSTAGSSAPRSPPARAEKGTVRRSRTARVLARLLTIRNTQVFSDERPSKRSSCCSTPSQASCTTG